MGKGRFTRLNVRIGLVQGFYWMASCVFVSFLVRLLHSYGYSDLECGVALSISAFASLSMQPVLGAVADRMKKVGTLIVCCFLLSSLGSLGILFLHESRVLTYVLVFLIFAFFRTLVYIIDLWSYGAGGEDSSFSYGFTRSFGAVFYALSALFYGYAIDRFGTTIIIPCFVGMSMLSLLMVLCSPPVVKSPKEKEEVPSLGSALSLLLHNRHYVVLLLSYALVEMSAIPCENYLTRKFEVLGAGEIYTGAAFLLMGILQIPTLNKMETIGKKFQPKSLVWVAVGGIMLRVAIIGYAKTSLGTVLSYLTEPFAFGLYIGSILLYMRHYLPKKVQYLGMTLYAAFSSGLGGVVGNTVAGVLAERFGILTMLRLMGIPSILGWILLSGALLSWRRKEQP